MTNKCCYCANVPLAKFNFQWGGGVMETAMAIGNIGIGSTSTLATINKDLGKKCFAFTKLDAGEIRRIKKEAFA